MTKCNTAPSTSSFFLFQGLIKMWLLLCKKIWYRQHSPKTRICLTNTKSLPHCSVWGPVYARRNFPFQSETLSWQNLFWRQFEWQLKSTCEGLAVCITQLKCWQQQQLRPSLRGHRERTYDENSEHETSTSQSLIIRDQYQLIDCNECTTLMHEVNNRGDWEKGIWELSVLSARFFQ